MLLLCSWVCVVDVFEREDEAVRYSERHFLSVEGRFRCSRSQREKKSNIWVWHAEVQSSFMSKNLDTDLWIPYSVLCLWRCVRYPDPTIATPKAVSIIDKRISVVLLKPHGSRSEGLDLLRLK